MAALPLVAGGFDYLENAAAWIALIAYPAEAGLAQSLVGIASVGKQVFSWASWVLLAATITLMTIRFGAAPPAPRPCGSRFTDRWAAE